MSKFTDSLKEAVRQMAFRTSVDELKKQGVRKVNVLGVDRIIALIDEAVHRSLKNRLVGVEREAAAEATKAEFLRLLQSNEDLQRQKTEAETLRERAEEEVDQLRRELGTQREALQRKLQQGALGSVRHAGANAAIAQKITELFAAMATGGEAVNLGTAHARVLELVMDVVDSERTAADEARRALHDRDVDVLQRRIAKLVESLSHTEHRLQAVTAMKDLDNGISSVYREVQGLPADEARFGRKRELMTEIFRANLALQKKRDNSPGTPR